MRHPALEAESVREELVAILPRLERFAAVLSSEQHPRDEILRDACMRMMAEQHRRPRGSPFDRWAFSEMYRLWLERQREASQPIPGQVDDYAFMETVLVQQFGVQDTEVAAFLGSLTAQQRCALLLVHGEGYSYDDAAKILDTSVQTVVARVTRASTYFADKTSGEAGVAPAAEAVDQLFPSYVEETS